METVSVSDIELLIYGEQRDRHAYSTDGHVSWTSGIGSLHYRKRYRDFFSCSCPSWVNELHPDHIMALCGFAIKTKKVLPDSWTDCFKQEIDARDQTEPAKQEVTSSDQAEFEKQEEEAEKRAFAQMQYGRKHGKSRL